MCMSTCGRRCMCVYIYILEYIVYIHVCYICIYLRVYVCRQAGMHVNTFRTEPLHVHVHACSCLPGYLTAWPSYLATGLPAYIHTRKHIRTYIQTCIQTYTHTHMHTYIHPYIHTCMHACIHTHIHACTHYIVLHAETLRYIIMP